MAETSIPVDLFNPGQVFACLGFLEAADALLGGAKGGFNWHDEDDIRFHLAARGDGNPLAAILGFLAEADVVALAPSRSSLSTAKWNVPTIGNDESRAFPFPIPSSPATLPVLLRAPSGKSVLIDHWGDATRRDNVKFWAGSGGYPGAALMRDALALLPGQTSKAIENPFALSAPQNSSFRFDRRRDYVPIDAGFSPNAHSAMSMLGFPLTEILATIGLSHGRPLRVNKLHYRYGVLGSDGKCVHYDPIFLRAALGLADLPFLTRRFDMILGWPGQENQARCIIHVTEEPTS